MPTTKLNAQQKAVVALDYVEGDWEGWMPRSFEELEGEVPSTDAYMAKERRATAYATQVAYAIWGEDAVVRVQYRVSRHNVVPFVERNTPGAHRPDPTFSTTGWRTLLEEEGQNRGNSADVFRSQFERMQN